MRLISILLITLQSRSEGRLETLYPDFGFNVAAGPVDIGETELITLI